MVFSDDAERRWGDDNYGRFRPCSDERSLWDQTIVTPGPVTLMDVSSDGRFVLFCHARMGENGPVAVIDVSSGLELNIPLMQGEWATAGTLASSDLALWGLRRVGS